MVKSYKTFIKEYSMGLQVPSTSYLKGVGSLRNLTKKETSTNNKEKTQADGIRRIVAWEREGRESC